MAADRRPLTEEEVRAIRTIERAREQGTYYDVLGIPPSASQDEVETAYHAFARVWHPDRFYSRDTSILSSVIEENFVAGTRALRTLRDVSLRAAYHRERGIDVSEPTSAPRPESPARPTDTVDARTSTPGGTPVVQPAAPRPPPKPAAPPPPPKPKAPAAIERIRQQVAEQVRRARQYYASGKEDFDAGLYSKAESALYLACQFDPRNPEYAELHKLAVQRGRETKARTYLMQAVHEETAMHTAEAIVWYQRAIECDPPEGLAWYRLAMLLKNYDKEERNALQHFRRAVQKEPGNLMYRMALAEIYESLGLAANAQREATAVLALDPTHAAAKAMAKRLRT